DASPALPRQEARDRAIEAALAAFDARPAHAHGEAHQGMAAADRLRIAAIAALNLVTGKRPMRMSHVLAGGASLAVLTLAVMTATNLQMLQRGDWRQAPATLDQERAK